MIFKQLEGCSKYSGNLLLLAVAVFPILYSKKMKVVQIWQHVMFTYLPYHMDDSPG